MSCYRAADILLPDFSKTDALRWSVVACDQFTSEPSYWEKAEALVGDAPSTLRMILPEVWLSETEQRLPGIRAAMRHAMTHILREHPDSVIYTERVQSDGSIRRGLVLAVDLEAYDFHKGSDSLIRATEATVVERIPPRVAVRRDAVVELPHIMLLIDDPKGTVIEPLSSKDGSAAYDTDLMLGGGHITGTFLSEEAKARVYQALDALITADAMKERYGDKSLSPLLFAVGDGNHSLASAKAAYEEIKQALGREAALEHPARFALAEVVNLHDRALKFEPIYRVMFNVSAEDVLASLSAYLKELDGSAEPQYLDWITRDGHGHIEIPRPARQLPVGTLQEFIDGYLKVHPEGSVDYIHGEDSVRMLVQRENTVGFLFAGMEKDQLFKTVIFDGALPRKTFSMGHAEDKRYYLECRRIVTL